MELDFDKYCVVDGSPTTVLPGLRSRRSNQYNSFDIRKKIEFSRENAPALPLEIINSLCGLDEEGDLDLLLERSKSWDSVDHTVVSDSAVALINCCKGTPSASLHNKFSLPRPPSDVSESRSPNPRFHQVSDPFVKTRSHRSPLSETCSNADKTSHDSALVHSPAHLHGHLRWKKKKHVLEFSVKSPEYVYIAKAWKAGNSLTWVYTFHSVKKSNASSSLKFRESCMIGQMLVSKGDDASMVTEFVLYDIAHSRKTSASHNDEKTMQPLAAAELHPGLEIAAIVIQLPFEKRESLKFKNGTAQCQFEMVQDTDTWKIYVVIPVGIHGLPETASPLLERWRLDGRCDCGGWDMACPLNVLTSHDPSLLFVQGKKGDLPVFSMRATEKENYAVDFHAKISTLQAFSISVAVLHAGQSSEHQKNLLHDEEPKLTPHKRADEMLPSFMINPPFSPIARV